MEREASASVEAFTPYFLHFESNAGVRGTVRNAYGPAWDALQRGGKYLGITWCPFHSGEYNVFEIESPRTFIDRCDDYATGLTIYPEAIFNPRSGCIIAIGGAKFNYNATPMAAREDFLAAIEDKSVYSPEQKEVIFDYWEKEKLPIKGASTIVARNYNKSIKLQIFTLRASILCCLIRYLKGINHPGACGLLGGLVLKHLGLDPSLVLTTYPEYWQIKGHIWQPLDLL